MIETKENNSILKVCGYCLKIFKSSNKDKVGCNECLARVDLLIKRGTMSSFMPKTLEERISKLEKNLQRKVEDLEKEIKELKRKH